MDIELDNSIWTSFRVKLFNMSRKNLKKSYEVVMKASHAVVVAVASSTWNQTPVLLRIRASFTVITYNYYIWEACNVSFARHNNHNLLINLKYSQQHDMIDFYMYKDVTNLPDNAGLKLPQMQHFASQRHKEHSCPRENIIELSLSNCFS